MIDRAEIRAEAMRLRACFEKAGATPVEAAVLQSAETLLDLYGEDIRARAYVTADTLRGEQMLRPDFTVPVVQQHMECGTEAARYTYAGEVFRRQEIDPDRPSEFMQVGFEVFGESPPERVDAEIFALFSEILEQFGLRAATGDMGLLLAAVDGLSASPARRAALMRHVWRPRRFRGLLERFSGRRQPPAERSLLLGKVAAGEDVLNSAGTAIGLRTDAEILERLDRLVEDTKTPDLSISEVDLLDQILGLKASASAALEALRDIAVDLPAVAGAVDRFKRRLDALVARGIEPDALPFEGSFGRTTLEYYDGFVFGFMVAGRPDLPSVATGGRYDALTRILGQGNVVPAAGGVIRPELTLMLSEAGQ